MASPSYIDIPVVASRPMDAQRLSFLDLPAEIRLEIYGYLFKLDRRIRFQLGTDDGWPTIYPAYGSTNFLLSCREVYSQGSEILYGGNVFEFRDDKNKATPSFNGVLSWMTTIGPRSCALIRRIILKVKALCRCNRLTSNDMVEFLPLLKLILERDGLALTLELSAPSRGCPLLRGRGGRDPGYAGWSIGNVNWIIQSMKKGWLREHIQLLSSVKICRRATKFRLQYRAGNELAPYVRVFEVRLDQNGKDTCMEEIDHVECYQPKLDRLPTPVLNRIFDYAMEAPTGLLVSSPARHAARDPMSSAIRLLGVSSKLRATATDAFFAENTFVFEEVSREPVLSPDDFGKYYKWHETIGLSRQSTFKLRIILNFLLPEDVRPDQVRVNIGDSTRFDYMDGQDTKDVTFCIRVTSGTGDTMVHERETEITLDTLFDRAAEAFDASREEFMRYFFPGIWVNCYGEIKALSDYKGEYSDNGWSDNEEEDRFNTTDEESEC